MWRRIADNVYRDRPTTRENMIARITNKINSLDYNETRRAEDEFKHALNKMAIP